MDTSLDGFPIDGGVGFGTIVVEEREQLGNASGVSNFSSNMRGAFRSLYRCCMVGVATETSKVVIERYGSRGAGTDMAVDVIRYLRIR